METDKQTNIHWDNKKKTQAKPRLRHTRLIDKYCLPVPKVCFSCVPTVQGRLGFFKEKQYVKAVALAGAKTLGDEPPGILGAAEPRGSDCIPAMCEM